MPTLMLSILIATQGRRQQKFEQLLKKLTDQAELYKGQIEIVAYWNNGELPIGVIRQKLVEAAQGEYICFVDDDDDVPSYYCREIIEALKHKNDYVGFQVQFFNNGVEGLPVYHDLKYPVWQEDHKGYYRGVTHLNPIRRSIALKGTFTVLGAGEDADWARSIRHLVHTQTYIDKIMYRYYHDADDTSFGGYNFEQQDYARPEFNYDHFRYHPENLGVV